jgi:hypothetical protein
VQVKEESFRCSSVAFFISWDVTLGLNNGTNKGTFWFLCSDRNHSSISYSTHRSFLYLGITGTWLEHLFTQWSLLCLPIPIMNSSSPEPYFLYIACEGLWGCFKINHISILFIIFAKKPHWSNQQLPCKTQNQAAQTIKSVTAVCST